MERKRPSEYDQRLEALPEPVRAYISLGNATRLPGLDRRLKNQYRGMALALFDTMTPQERAHLYEFGKFVSTTQHERKPVFQTQKR